MGFEIRRVLDPQVYNDLVRAMNAAVHQGRARSSGVIGNGGTAGRLRTTEGMMYELGGVLYVKGATDDLWNLSALTTLAAGTYQAVILFLDSSGAASITACTSKSTAAAALAEVEANLVATKSAVGVFVAGPSTNYANALAAQGTIYNGIPDGAFAKDPVSGAVYSGSQNRAGLITPIGA